MPLGIVWLIVGTLIGVAAGWLLVDNFAAGGAAGFLITLVLLLTGTFLGGRDKDDDGDVTIAGR